MLGFDIYSANSISARHFYRHSNYTHTVQKTQIITDSVFRHILHITVYTIFWEFVVALALSIIELMN